jgi:S-layer protein
MAVSQYFDQVQKLYVAYFGRPADPAGLNYWSANIDAAGGSINNVVAGFAASNESQALYAGGNTAQLVSSIYLALFNRTPEAAGLAYWVAQIDGGTVSGARAAYQILSNAGPGDATSISNKLAAANAFTAQIDTQAEINGYVGTTAASYARTYLSKVDATAGSLSNAINSQTLANTVAVASNTVVTSTPTAPAIQTFTLTTGADTFTGTDGNDNFVGTLAGAFSKGDSINGGSGTDTLTVTDSGNIDSTGVTVTNVENASFTAGGSLLLNTTIWTGLQALTAQSTALSAGSININGGVNVTVKASNSTTGNITVGGTTAPSGEINITNSSTGAVSMGSIAVTGGSKVTVNQQATNALNTTTTLGTVTVNGTTQTTSVTTNNATRATQSVTTAGVTANSVVINDKNGGSTTLAGTITDISISNYTNAQIQDTALKNLTLVNGSGNVLIDNSLLAVNKNVILNVSTNGVTGGALTASAYTTLNLTTTGTASTLANINIATLLNLNVTGSNVQTLTAAAGMSSLNAVTVTGSAGLIANLSGATLTSVDASATSGNMTVIVDASKATYSGGSGIDVVTLVNAATISKAISGGAGSSDRVVLDATAAASASASATFATKVTGFEQLGLTGATNQTIDVGALGFSYVSTSGGNGLTLNGLSSGATLELTSAGTAYTVAGAFTGGSDTLNLKLIQGDNFSTTFAFNGITATGVETIAISSLDTQATPTGTFSNLLNLQGNDVNNITASGNAGLNLTAASTALTKVDASGITLGGFTWTAGAITATVAVKGSLTGTNTVDLSSVTGAVTYTGGSGNDIITVGKGINTLTGGAGSDSYTFGATTRSTLSNLDTITDYRTSGTDFITITDIGVVSSNLNTVQNVSDQGSLALALDVIANAATTSNGLSVFIWGGNTYAYVETTGATTTYQASDTVIKLTGTPFTASSSIVGLGIDAV